MRWRYRSVAAAETASTLPRAWRSFSSPSPGHGTTNGESQPVVRTVRKLPSSSTSPIVCIPGWKHLGIANPLIPPFFSVCYPAVNTITAARFDKCIPPRETGKTGREYAQPMELVTTAFTDSQSGAVCSGEGVKEENGKVTPEQGGEGCNSRKRSIFSSNYTPLHPCRRSGRLRSEFRAPCQVWGSSIRLQQ